MMVTAGSTNRLWPITEAPPDTVRAGLGTRSLAHKPELRSVESWAQLGCPAWCGGARAPGRPGLPQPAVLL